MIFGFPPSTFQCLSTKRNFNSIPIRRHIIMRVDNSFWPRNMLKHQSHRKKDDLLVIMVSPSGMLYDGPIASINGNISGNDSNIIHTSFTTDSKLPTWYVTSPHCSTSPSMLLLFVNTDDIYLSAEFSDSWDVL
jgi:hypothetical protein